MKWVVGLENFDCYVVVSIRGVGWENGGKYYEGEILMVSEYRVWGECLEGV